MASNDETLLDAAEPKHGTTKIKLACGNSVPFVHQVAIEMCKFSTRYVPCNDSSDFCRMFGKLPFDADFNAIFGFPTTIEPGFYIPRTHGQWWSQAPSGLKEDFMPQNNDLSVGHDFVDFMFETEVFPLRICIFEAFSPGCIIRIWAEDFDTKLWHKLWSGPVENCLATTHRIFCPSIETCNWKTKLLRFELSHSHLEYYTQLEGAFLIGTSGLIVPLEKSPSPNLEALYHNMKGPKNYEEFEQNNRVCHQVLEDDLAKLKKIITTNWVLPESANKNKVANDNLLTGDSIGEPASESVSDNETRNVFDVLPDEALLKILKNLDLRSLLRCSRVNKRFNCVTRDGLLYTSLNLKPYWNLVDAAALKYLTPRCKYLRRLDMSWCGNYENSMIKPEDMSKFIDDCGELLTNLRLNCCQFVNDDVAEKISSCKELKELCLNNCRKISDNGFKNLEKLPSLERLELYRAKIKTATLCSIIQGNPRMRHLNLAETRALEMNVVANKIVDCCLDLESIDCWYSRSLSFDGLKAFSRCTNLREIDFGWCPELYNLDDRREDSMRMFLSGCSSLEKIGLTAQPFFTDRDFEPLHYNQKLQQLHLAGAANVKPVFFDKLLSRCPEIRMIDLNCYRETKLQILMLREMYPEVSIKWRSCYTRRGYEYDEDDD